MDLSTSLALASVAVLFPGLVTMVVALRSAPAPVGPTSGDGTLGSEPPAVVDLLTGGFVVEDDALLATIVDLAARGIIGVEPGDRAGSPVRLRLEEAVADTDLLGFERRVVQVLRSAGAIERAVTTEVFAGEDGVVPRRWWRGFVADVVAHAAALGLTRPRFGRRHVFVMGGAWVVGAASAVVVTVGWNGWDGGVDLDAPVGFVAISNWIGLLGVAVVSIGLVRSAAQSPTPAGAGVAARWLDVRRAWSDDGEAVQRSVLRASHRTALAVALGAAPLVVGELPVETDHDRHAWSSASGVWRRVRIRYASARPHWGHSPWWAVLSGGLQALAFGCLHVAAMLVADDRLGLVDTVAADGDLRGPRTLAVVVAGVAAPLALFGAASTVAGLADVVIDAVSPRTVEGVVVARRRLPTGHRVPGVFRWLLWSGRDLRASGPRMRYHLAVDDGRREVVLAHQVRPAVFERTRRGAFVRMRVTPLLGHVSDITESTPPPRSDGAFAHGLVEAPASLGLGPSFDHPDIGDEPDAPAR